MNIRIGKHTIKGIGLLMMALMLLAACGSETEADSQQDTDDISVDDMNDAIDELEDIAEEAEAEADIDADSGDSDDSEETTDEDADNSMDISLEHQPANYSYTMVNYSQVGDGPGQTVTTEVYFKGSAYYVLTNNVGYFYHPEDKSLAMYSVEENTVYIMEGDQDPSDENLYTTPWDTATGMGEDIEEMMSSDEFYAGEETVSGVMTRKYIYEFGDTKVTAYYDPEKKIVSKYQYEVGDTTSYIEYLNYEEGSVTDADIAYPDGVEVIDLRELGNMQ